MQWFDTVVDYVKSYAPTIDWRDVLEILIITVLLYYILDWMKTTRAWLLLRGLILIFVFLVVAFFLDMTTILWVAQNALGFVVTAIIVVMQPELRHALEDLGKKNFFPSALFSDASRRENSAFSEKTVNEITKACMEMGKVKTGALIVIEQTVALKDYERTGIEVDGIVTSQLLINIFEHNTPLHDGAVIVRGNRVTSATCYLPLSDNLGLSKELGTRHRAGVGISEATDSVTVIVSEETGHISVAYEGELTRNLTGEALKTRLLQMLEGGSEEKKAKGRHIWMGKGRSKNEKKNIS